MPMKRRPGMSIPEFREYYETQHRLIGEKYLAGYANPLYTTIHKPDQGP